MIHSLQNKWPFEHRHGFSAVFKQSPHWSNFRIDSDPNRACLLPQTSRNLPYSALVNVEEAVLFLE